VNDPYEDMTWLHDGFSFSREKKPIGLLRATKVKVGVCGHVMGTSNSKPNWNAPRDKKGEALQLK
jgi:hypothetical protein